MNGTLSSSTGTDTPIWRLLIAAMVVAKLPPAGAGVLSFAITSMHEVEQMVGGTNPNFYNRESTDTAAIKPSMEIVAYVPEPGFAAGLAASLVALAGLDRRRSTLRRHL